MPPSGSDALIGFPGESESAFENTYKLIDKLPISYLHVFPFSSRPGTKAANLPNKVNAGIIKDRCERMRILGNEKRMTFYQVFVAQVLPILIETKREASTNFLKGISSNYLPVLIDAGDHLKNKIVDVKIQKLEGVKLFGNIRLTLLNIGHRFAPRHNSRFRQKEYRNVEIRYYLH